MASPMLQREYPRRVDGSGFVPEIATIRRVSDEVRALADSFVVLLALNGKPLAGSLENDYAGFSVTSEYLSDAELKQLQDGFASIGCIVDCSHGEKEFNERLVRGDFAQYDGLHKIVYHSTGSGTARCRTAFMPALCELYRLSDCANDVYSSTISENKVHFFNLLSFHGFPIPRTWFYDPKHGWLTGEPLRGIKLIAKPAYESASVGVDDTSVSLFDDAFFGHIRAEAETMAQPVVVQQFVEGYEVEVPVFDLGQPFTPMSIGIDMNGSKLAGEAFLTYERVYDDRYTFYSFCRHKPELGAALRKIASESFRKLGLRGMMRVDFRVGEDGNALIMDYNNAPHVTEFHSCARAVKELGFAYGDMLCLLLYSHMRAAANLR